MSKKTIENATSVLRDIKEELYEGFIKAWVARDKDGMLFLYIAKPRKSQSKWLPNIRFEFIELSREFFPEVKWEDEEPTEVIITIKLDKAQWKTKNFHSSAVGRAITACLTLE